jgi:hypothetical protein
VAQAKAAAAQVQRQIWKMVMSNSSMRLPVFMPIIVDDNESDSSHDRPASFPSMEKAFEALQYFRSFRRFNLIHSLEI